MKKTLITLATTLGSILIVTTLTYAIGTLTPSGTAGDATQYTLNDIYTKLTTGTATSTKTGSMTVPSSVSASFHTLTEIYNSIPATLSITASTTTVPVGINRATTSLATIDTDLTAGNIKSGVTVFGVTGNMSAGVVYPTEWSAEDPVGKVSWATAILYCDGLVWGGHDDWRLPTYIELLNAYLSSNPGNTLNFRMAEYYRTITEYPGSPTGAYIIYMGNGIATYDDNALVNSYARCVR